MSCSLDPAWRLVNPALESPQDTSDVGAAGVNGPCSGPSSGSTAGGSSFRRGVVENDLALGGRICADPAAYYANYHTTDFPAAPCAAIDGRLICAAKEGAGPAPSLVRWTDPWGPALIRPVVNAQTRDLRRLHLRARRSEPRVWRVKRVEAANRYDAPVERGFAFITDTANWSKFWPGYVRLEKGSR